MSRWSIESYLGQVHVQGHKQTFKLRGRKFNFYGWKTESSVGRHLHANFGSFVFFVCII